MSIEGSIRGVSVERIDEGRGGAGRMDQRTPPFAVWPAAEQQRNARTKRRQHTVRSYLKLKQDSAAEAILQQDSALSETLNCQVVSFLLVLARTPFSGAQQKRTPPGRPVEPTLVLTAISSLLPMRLTIHRPKIFWTSVAASKSAIPQCCTLLGFLNSFPPLLLPRLQPATGAPWSSPSPTGTHATSVQPSSRRSVKHGSRRPTGSLRSNG